MANFESFEVAATLVGSAMSARYQGTKPFVYDYEVAYAGTTGSVVVVVQTRK